MVANVGEQPLLLLLAAFRGQFFGNLIWNEAGSVMRHTVVDRAPGLLHGGERDLKYGGKLLFEPLPKVVLASAERTLKKVQT